MSMIKIENLTFAYPGNYDNVFEHVNFQIDTDWKLGFVGRNGRGKTTFLRLLLNQYEYSGNIISSVNFEYFPYVVPDKTLFTYEVLEKVCPFAEEWEIIRELSYLQVDAEVLYRSYQTLSNGEQTKVLLAALFLKESCFLLLDEPTNHLDMSARRVIGEYLKRKKGFILVSHDRQLLDECVTHILSVNRMDIEVQKGNFSSWQQNFEWRQKNEQMKHETLKKEIRRLQQTANRTAEWSDKTETSKFNHKKSGSKVDRGYIGHKAAKMMKRSKNVQGRQQIAVEEKKELMKNAEKKQPLKLFPLKYHAEELVYIEELAISYGERKICYPLSFQIKRGDRIALSGQNGCGKSSVLKLLTGKELVYSGIFRLSGGIKISYVPQDTAHFSGTLSVYAEKHNIDETLFKSILRKMDLERVQFEKDISSFSQGQKKKVLLAGSLCEQAHLYIWDEPLNYIDVYSRMQIEELLEKFMPTMIFVEHDKTFCDAIATKIIEIKSI